MRKFNNFKTLIVGLLLVSIYAMPLTAMAQTQIKMPKNKYKIEDDIKIGREVAAEADKVFPYVNDRATNDYIQEVGRRLVSSFPPQFQQPAFNCNFKIVNASDINAFAIPGCYLYVNRGMIEASKNEGEMAGVMAHEIAHAMLRHGTAGQTKQSSIGNQIKILGAIIGGAILAGEAGAQAGMLYAQWKMTKYSREFEQQSDIVGAQTLARAGYDPRDLANMFRTIAGERSGNAPPEWLSSHPDPGNRYNYINKEADMLRISPNPIKITQGFERAQRYLRSLPKAKTMEQIEKEAQGNSGQNPTNGGKYSKNVPLPSNQTRSYNAGNVVTANIPTNWKEFPSNQSVMFAPEGAYGDNGITHGVMMGVSKGNGGNLQQETDAYVKGLLQGNDYLRAQGNYSSGKMSGRNALAIQLAGTSSTTGKTEVVTIYTTQISSGDLLYVITVVPQNESQSYATAFRNFIGSIKINDR